MEENQISLTAIMAAYLRAYHSMYDDPKIFDDFLAYEMIPEENRKLIEEGFINSVKLSDPGFAALPPDLAGALARVMPGLSGLCHTLGRSRYAEDSLEKAINQGVKQYVILGAGLDTFAFRRRDLLNSLKVFELDHPFTQSFKRSRIEELGWDVPEGLHFVPVDFTKDNLLSGLVKSPCDSRLKSLFSWLGVSMYLTREEIFKTLTAVREITPTGSTVIFDYLDKVAFDSENAAPRIRKAMFMAVYAGEPMQTGFDPDNLHNELSGIGFRLVENLRPADFQERYFEGSKYVACEHFYCARAEAV